MRGFTRFWPGKQSALWPRRLPPGAQQCKEVRRQHHVAVFVALALFDANDHALAVDVADLELDDLGGAQASPISHTQRRLVFEPRRCIQQVRHLLRTEDDRQLARRVGQRRVLDDVVSPERGPEKELQR